MCWVLARARLWTGHQWDTAGHPWVIPRICPGFLRREGLPRSASKRLRPVMGKKGFQEAGTAARAWPLGLHPGLLLPV